MNTHHLADQVHDFLRAEPWSFLLSVSHEPEILGTGGGLRQLGEVLREGPFLAINADILTDLDLAEVYRGHRPGAVSTLVLHDCPAYNNVWVAGEAVVSIGAAPPVRPAPMQNPWPTPGSRWWTGRFSGISRPRAPMIWSRPGGRPWRRGSGWLTSRCRAISGRTWARRRITWRRTGGSWPGPGLRLAGYFPGLTDPLIGPGARIGAGAHFGGGVCLGSNVVVGEGAALKNTVVWDRAGISPDVELEDCIVAAGVEVKDSARGRVLVA